MTTTADQSFICGDGKVAELTELVGIIRCYFGYHVWPGDPWDHCLRCFVRLPEQALLHHGELATATYGELCAVILAEAAPLYNDRPGGSA